MDMEHLKILLALILSVGSALGGLIMILTKSNISQLHSHFEGKISGLEEKLQSHVEKEERFQTDLSAILRNMDISLATLTAQRESYVSRDNLNEALRRVENQQRAEMEAKIQEVEQRIGQQLTEIKDAIFRMDR